MAQKWRKGARVGSRFPSRDDSRPLARFRFDGPLEPGQQRAGEPGPYQALPAASADPARLILAPRHDKDTRSRRYLTLTSRSDDRDFNVILPTIRLAKL